MSSPCWCSLVLAQFGAVSSATSIIIFRLWSNSCKVPVRKWNERTATAAAEKVKEERTCMKHVQHGTGLQKLEYFHASVPQTSSHSLGLNNHSCPATTNQQVTHKTRWESLRWFWGYQRTLVMAGSFCNLSSKPEHENRQRCLRAISPNVYSKINHFVKWKLTLILV